MSHACSNEHPGRSKTLEHRLDIKNIKINARSAFRYFNGCKKITYSNGGSKIQKFL